MSIMKIPLVLVRNMWWFSVSPLFHIRNYIFTRYYHATNKMSVGNYVTINSAHPSDVAYLKIGKDFQIGSFALIDYSGGVEIGDGVTLSEGAKLYTHNHTITDATLSWRLQPIQFSSLKIGDGAWIGAGSIVVESVSYIGKGAIIGAGSVVTKSIPDFRVAVGNPARVIKQRGSSSLA